MYRFRVSRNGASVMNSAWVLTVDDERYLTSLGVQQEYPKLKKLHISPLTVASRLPQLIPGADAQVRFSWFMLGR